MPEMRDTSQRLEEFIDWFGAIHHLDEAYTEAEHVPQHERNAKILYETSLRFLDRLPSAPGQRALDVGLGYGYHCEWFVEHGFETTGIAVHVTPEIEKHADEHGYKVQRMDMHLLDYEDQAFDLVWSHHSLEHSFSPLLALREWYRVLKPGGSLAVTVPAHKQDIVSGHFNVGWSVGQLMYLLAICGFDTESGFFIEEGYNVRALVARPPRDPDCDGVSWMFKARERLPRAVRDHVMSNPASLGKYRYDGAIQEAHGTTYIAKKTPSASAQWAQNQVRRARRLYRRLRNRNGRSGGS
jgi:SAM-dependent methyltransferase